MIDIVSVELSSGTMFHYLCCHYLGKGGENLGDSDTVSLHIIDVFYFKVFFSLQISCMNNCELWARFPSHYIAILSAIWIISMMLHKLKNQWNYMSLAESETFRRTEEVRIEVARYFGCLFPAELQLQTHIQEGWWPLQTQGLHL